MLAPDMRLLSQRQRTLWLEAIKTSQVLTFSCAIPQPQIAQCSSKRARWHLYTSWVAVQDRNHELKRSRFSYCKPACLPLYLPLSLSSKATRHVEGSEKVIQNKGSQYLSACKTCRISYPLRIVSSSYTHILKVNIYAMSNYRNEIW